MIKNSSLSSLIHNAQVITISARLVENDLFEGDLKGARKELLFITALSIALSEQLLLEIKEEEEENE
jgi:hypothetical protein